MCVCVFLSALPVVHIHVNHLPSVCLTQESTKLRELDLGYNEIKDDGACALAQVSASVFSGVSVSV